MRPGVRGKRQVDPDIALRAAQTGESVLGQLVRGSLEGRDGGSRHEGAESDAGGEQEKSTEDRHGLRPFLFQVTVAPQLAELFVDGLGRHAERVSDLTDGQASLEETEDLCSAGRELGHALHGTA